MKLIIGDQVYLQRYDVNYISRNLYNFPSSLSLAQELLHNDNDRYTHGSRDVRDAFIFSCVFRDPLNVKWLKNQKWIVDFDYYKYFSVDRMILIYQKQVEKYDSKVDAFNSKSRRRRLADYSEFGKILEQEKHRLASFETMIDYLRGRISFVFPDGYTE